MTIDASFENLDKMFEEDLNYLNDVYSNFNENTFDNSMAEVDSRLNYYYDNINNIDIETSLNDLTDSYIGNMDSDHNKINSLFTDKYYVYNKKLKKIMTQYDTIVANTDNSMKTDTYVLLLIWAIIFYFVSSALFLSIVEDKKELNFFSKTLLILFVIVIGYYTIKNGWRYIKNIA
tara:strand:+ start:19748 stop:20275 length:528 start_codon:yes stop_codon:yes gene_type:complete